MIGIIGAMAPEVEALQHKMTVRKTVTVSGIDFHVGAIHGKDVVVAKCGVGKVYAALCAQTMILRFSPDLVLNTGVGGALNPALKIGDLVIAERTVQHDMDTSALGDPVGLVSGINQIYFPCDRKAIDIMCTAVAACGFSRMIGTVASGDQFICNAADKDRIVTQFEADVCEMEGAAIGHVCTVNAVPYLVLRAASDQADGSAPDDFPTFVKHAAAKATAVVDKFIDFYD